MIVQCPSCEAKYEVDMSSLGARGRTVRCTRCKTQWTQAAEPGLLDDGFEEDEELLVVDGEGADGPGGEEEETGFTASLDDDFEMDPVEQPPAMPGDGGDIDGDIVNQVGPLGSGGGAGMSSADIMDAAPIPLGGGFDLDEAIEAERKPRAGWIKWLLLLLVLAGLGAAGHFYRQQVITHWPPSIQAYDWIDVMLEGENFGLEVMDVAFRYERVRGKQNLVVEGRVVNHSKRVKELPRLRASLLDENGKRIIFWTVPLPVESLKPGADVAFTTRQKEPPTNAKSLTVDFVIN